MPFPKQLSEVAFLSERMESVTDVEVDRARDVPNDDFGHRLFGRRYVRLHQPVNVLRRVSTKVPRRARALLVIRVSIGLVRCALNLQFLSREAQLVDTRLQADATNS